MQRNIHHNVLYMDVQPLFRLNFYCVCYKKTSKQPITPAIKR